MKTKLYNARRRQLYMQDGDYETLKKLGNGNASKGLRRIMSYADRAKTDKTLDEIEARIQAVKEQHGW